MQIERRHLVAAAWVAVAYIAIQSFQWYVFAQLPAEGGAADALRVAREPLNLWRAALMLLSFFGLCYLFLVLCASSLRRAPVASVAAFLGFFVFCLLEVCLRAIEFFYVYLQLGAQFLAAAPAEQARIVAMHDTFYAVQGALYFPLGLSQVIASVLLSATMRGPWSGIVRAVLAINALRLALRMLDVYAFGPPTFDDLYGTLYLPLVFVVFGGIALWGWRAPAPSRGPAA
jgi:hypothetical protein